MRAIIVGGGRVARCLANRLMQEYEEVSIVVDRPRAAEHLASLFPHALVILGNGNEEAVLRDAGASSCEVLFAVGEDDSHNMVACLLAKERFSVRHVVGLASAGEDKPAFSTLGIESVCVPDVLADALVASTQG